MTIGRSVLMSNMSAISRSPTMHALKSDGQSPRRIGYSRYSKLV